MIAAHHLSAPRKRQKPKTYSLSSEGDKALLRELQRRLHEDRSRELVRRVATADKVTALLTLAERMWTLGEGTIRGSRRTRLIAEARHVAAKFIRMNFGLSLQEVGEAIGGRHHGTVINSIERVNQRKDLQRAYKQLCAAWAQAQQG